MTSDQAWAPRSAAGIAESPRELSRARATEALYAADRDVRGPWDLDEETVERVAPAAKTRSDGKEQFRLARLRLYSYCMTLSACVLALMAFMYLLTGTSDGDAGFTSIGIMFTGMMIIMLWAAMRVTKAGESA